MNMLDRMMTVQGAEVDMCWEVEVPMRPSVNKPKFQLAGETHQEGQNSL